MEDEWKKIDGYTNYIVNREGVVRNVNTGQVLQGSYIKGRLWVSLSSDGKLKQHYVDTLVKKYFKTKCCDDEVWKIIDGYDNYMVSTCGRVLNIKKDIMMKGTCDPDGYKRVEIVSGVTRKSHGVHQLVARAFVEMNEDAQVIDHINRVRDDNHASNLRWVSFQMNAHNRSKRHTASSKYFGVYTAEPKYRFKAAIRNGNTYHFLGYFENEEEAAKAYDIKAVELFGEHARLNFQ